MFYQGCSLLNSLARPETLPSPRAAGGAREWVQAGVVLAMGRDLPAMALSQRLSRPDAYRRLQLARRQTLEALLPAEPTRELLTRATDVICMLVEEAAWADNPKGAPFDDDRHPDIDFQCAETAMLFAWTHRAFGDLLDSRVAGRLRSEVRRRVFSPFLAHGDYPFMRGRGERPVCILCDIILCALLLEDDPHRRSAILKQALRQLDQAIDARENRVLPLEEQLAGTAAVTDLCLLLRKATRGELDLTEVYPTADWLDALLFAWVDGDYFIDPAGQGMRPSVSGQELFRVGLAANDDALTALGARLHRSRRVPGATLTGRLLDIGCAGLLAAETRQPPKLKHAAVARSRVMQCRFSGMTCGLHTGGGRANAGSLTLFVGERPILVEMNGCADVPLIDGAGQLGSPDVFDAGAAFEADPCPADFDIRDDGELMSVDLTRAYPPESGLRSCQRTAMVQRRARTLRLVDALELNRPARVSCRFLTPQKPERLMNGLRLGPVDMQWESWAQADIEPLGRRFPDDAADGSALYAVTLSADVPAGRAFFALSFTTAQG